jgi:hypothetical protein
MNRPCESCGMMSCNGVECYFDEPDPAEPDPGETTLDQFKANHPEEVARIREWLSQGDAERLTECDPLLKRDAA